MKKAKYHFYTLTELLVVVAIAAILLGITLPAFNVLIKGNAMTSATNELAAKIKATRAYAITNNCYTALVFPADDTNFPADKAHFKYRSYRPCILNKVPDTTGTTTFYYEFDSWIDGENWTLIPPGIVFSSSTSATISNAPAFGKLDNVPTLLPDPSDPNKVIPNISSTLPTTTLKEEIGVKLLELLPEDTTNDDTVKFNRMMIFRPDGQLHENVIFSLQEGTVVNGNVVNSQDKPVYYTILVQKRSGKITYYDPQSEN